MQTAFQEKNVPIIMCASDHYAPYVSVVIQSILDCSSTNFNYDLLVLTKDMSELNRTTISQMAREYKNISIRFVDMSGYIENLQRQFLRFISHFTIESYFRIFIPYVLTGYKKVLYCDCDLVWLQDPAELYKIELGTNMFASVIDPTYIYNQKYCGPFWENYNLYVLGIPADAPYVNTGVMVWNIEMMREQCTLSYLQEIAKDLKFPFCDQDILNMLCEGQIVFLDPKWNVLADSGNCGNQINQMLKQLNAGMSYAEGREHPGVWHWCDKKKPWNTEMIDHGYLFWEFARKCPFYENILYRMAHDRHQEQASTWNYTTAIEGRI